MYYVDLWTSGDAALPFSLRGSLFIRGYDFTQISFKLQSQLIPNLLATLQNFLTLFPKCRKNFVDSPIIFYNPY